MHGAAPRDHHDIRRQTGLAAKVPQQAVIVFDEQLEDVGDEVFHFMGIEGRRPQMGRLLDRMRDHAEKAIDEFLPRPRFAREETLQKPAVKFHQGHEA
jgi:hypothetical protein